MLGYISVQDAAIKWEISERRIQKLYEENRIDGVVRFGWSWAIPEDVRKPVDKRKTRRTSYEKQDFTYYVKGKLEYI